MLYTVVVYAKDYAKEDVEALREIGGYVISNVHARRHLLDSEKMVVNIEIVDGDALDVIIRLKDFFKVEKVNIYKK